MKCGKQVQKKFKDSRKYALFGQEAIGSTWSLSKMNMFLHGDDNYRIEWGDTIRNPKLQDVELSGSQNSLESRRVFTMASLYFATLLNVYVWSFYITICYLLRICSPQMGSQGLKKTLILG